jgi:hypothetical protein
MAKSSGEDPRRPDDHSRGKRKAEEQAGSEGSPEQGDGTQDTESMASEDEHEPVAAASRTGAHGSDEPRAKRPKTGAEDVRAGNAAPVPSMVPESAVRPRPPGLDVAVTLVPEPAGGLVHLYGSIINRRSIFFTNPRGPMLGGAHVPTGGHGRPPAAPVSLNALVPTYPAPPPPAPFSAGLPTTALAAAYPTLVLGELGSGIDQTVPVQPPSAPSAAGLPTAPLATARPAFRPNAPRSWIDQATTTPGGSYPWRSGGDGRQGGGQGRP